MEEVKNRHPSYGVIQAHRVSTTGTYLVDGVSESRSYISISISFAEKTSNSLTKEEIYRPIHGEKICEIAMTPIQWASFLTTLNYDTGTVCTVTKLGMERVAPEPRSKITPIDRAHKELVSSVKEELSDIESRQKLLMEEIQNLNISKKKKDELLKKADLLNNTVSNIGFCARMFQEHCDTIVAKGKSEIMSFSKNAGVVGSTLGLGEETHIEIGGDQNDME